MPLVALVAFVLVAASGRNLPLFLLLNALGPATSDGLWANITVLGDTAVALALCLPLWRRRPDLLWALVLGGLLATAWVHGLKPWLDIARPPAVLGDAVHIIGPIHLNRAFPSGHATTAAFVAGLIALGLTSRVAFGAALLVALAAAASRSVVGVHWLLTSRAGSLAVGSPPWPVWRCWRFRRPLGVAAGGCWARSGRLCGRPAPRPRRGLSAGGLVAGRFAVAVLAA